MNEYDDFDRFLDDLKKELDAPQADARTRTAAAEPARRDRATRPAPPAPAPASAAKKASGGRSLTDFWWVFVILAAAIVAAALIGMRLLLAPAPSPAAAERSAPVPFETAGTAEEAVPEQEPEPAADLGEEPVTEEETLATGTDTALSGDVTVTIPREYYGSVTQEELAALAAEKGYLSAVLGGDGSVTYIMTRQQQEALLSEIQEEIDDSLSDFLASDDMPSLISIAPNLDYTSFRITVSGDTLSASETAAIQTFYTAGKRYNAYAGKGDAVIHVLVQSVGGAVVFESDSDSVG